MAGDFQWGSVPDLKLSNGVTLTQTQAIVRHLGIAHKGKYKDCLYPGKKNPAESYAIDLILEEH